MIALFCQGKDIQRVTSQAVGIGTREIPTADASSYFDAGQRVFISQPDGSDVEYLGTIQSVGSDAITVELATESGKSEGAPIWTPEAFFEWPAGCDVVVRRRRQSGVEIVRSLGGVGYATRVHEAYTVESVRYDNLADPRFAGLSSWFEQQAGDGLDEFTYVDAARVVRRVRLDAPTLEWTRTGHDLVSVGFDLHFLEDSSYV